MLHPVMVIDDDGDIRSALMDVLEEHGYATVGAVNGKDALDKLREPSMRPCLIVLDLMMPVMDGREFREHQLSTPELADIPVVVVSAYRNIDESAREMKVQAHLRKPLDGEELIAAARRYCQPEAA